MSVRFLFVLIAACAVIGAPLRADLIVTLSPRDENMNPIEGPAGAMYWRPLNMGDANEPIETVEAPPVEDDEEENSMRVLQ